MKQSRMGNFMWRHQGNMTIRDVAAKLGVDTVQAREIYDKEIGRRLHGED